jgi:hypothetical protein
MPMRVAVGIDGMSDHFSYSKVARRAFVSMASLATREFCEVAFVRDPIAINVTRPAVGASHLST